MVMQQTKGSPSQGELAAKPTERFVLSPHCIRTVGACIARPRHCADRNRRTANGRPYGCKFAASGKNAAFPPHFFTLFYSFFPQITPPIQSARMAAAAPRAKMDMAVGKMGCRGSLGAAVPTQSRAAFFACCSSS